MQESIHSPTPNGSSAFISVAVVQAALNSLVFQTSKNASTQALEALQLVNVWVANPDLPHFEDVRKQAVQSILITMIESGCENILRNLAIPLKLNTRKELLDSIRQVAIRGSAEGIGWHWLYVRYVRDELNVTTAEFCEAAFIDARTLRRLQTRAIKILTNHLVAEETQARAVHRKHLLRMRVPTPPAHGLFEREELIQSIMELFVQYRNVHLLIYGAPGVGKTQFVAAVLNQQIEAEHFHHIIWINRPQSVDAVIQQICSELFPADREVSLQVIAAHYRCAVVIDGCGAFWQAEKQVEALMALLSGFSVILINDLPAALPHLTAAVEIPPLSPQGAGELIDALLRNTSRAHYEDMIARAGGNPWAIKVLTMMPEPDIPELAEQQSGYRFLEACFLRFDAATQDLLFTTLLLSPQAVPVGLIRELAPNGFQPALAHLVRWGWLVTISQEFVALSESVVAFLKHLLQPGTRYAEHMHAVFVRVSNYIDEGRALAHLAVAGVLSDALVEPQPQVERQWIERYWFIGANRGMIVQWYTIVDRWFATHAVERLDPLRIVRSILQRRLGYWLEAAGHLRKLITDAGRVGEFELQAAALLELAALERCRGEIATAHSLIKQAKTTSIRRSNHDLWRRWHFEAVQVALAQMNGAEALDYLSHLELDRDFQVLQSEALYHAGNFEEAVATAADVLKQVRNDTALVGRLHTVLGQAYQELSDITSAFRHFNLALSTLEQSHEPFAIGRAQANLASVLLHMDYLSEASQLLEQARQTQIQLKDRIGLQFTEHNLAVLRHRWFRS